ncbi:MAG TPA: TPM domain-containing protein [Candidatus Limnocylindria bacterium]|nr:TPM domain-containing protein [Candidatus Limnocylindria bacterium]
MIRWTFSTIAAVVLVVGLLVVPRVLDITGVSATRFPDPVRDQAVYDPAGAVTPGVETAIEEMIDRIEERSGAEMVVYVRVEPSNDESNLSDARALIDQWGIGRAGYDDGFVILLSFNDTSFQHGVLSTYAGGGFKAVYLPESEQQVIRDEVVIPAIRQGSPEGGLAAAVSLVEAAITSDKTGRLEFFRIVNAMVGIPGGILALLLTLGSAYVTWRRYGDDPELVDSPSILMAGPPAGMTAPLATVIRQGRATQHSQNTLLVDLASRGLIRFRNLDRVGKVKSDDDPDPLTDPAIEVFKRPPGTGRLDPTLTDAFQIVQQQELGGVLARERLWKLNERLGGMKQRLEEEAVRLGWLSQRPSPMISRWTWIGVAEIVGGIGLAWLGYTIPMSGLTLLGAAFGVGGIGTVGFGSAMSQRTRKGAYVDGMLKAYRRTLRKTLEQARNMGEVVTVPEVAVLADTPDKAVLWGIALGLHDEVATVLERGLADPGVQADPSRAYYPTWLGTSSSSNLSSSSNVAAGAGLGGLFSGSGTPDIGGMFGALGSIGSTPASSSSGSGGGFGGGGSSGGGGGSSSF